MTSSKLFSPFPSLSPSLGRLLLLFCLLTLPSLISGRADDDTETVNSSFKDQIEGLFGENQKCRIKVNDKFEEAKAAVQPAFKLPTCLKVFYANSHLSGCGKPMYNKFKYCAKALHYGNKDYTNIDFKAMWKKQRQILVLIDGCLSCPMYPERAANLKIKMLSRFGDEHTKELASTKSDRFGDFKIGALVKVNEKKMHQIQPYLEIEHHCNQYHMWQKKKLTLPILQPHKMNQLIFESLITAIPLSQQDIIEVTVNLLG